MDKKTRIIGVLLVLIILLGIAGILARHSSGERSAVPTTASTTQTQTTKTKATINLEVATEASSTYMVAQGKAKGSLESEDITANTTKKTTTTTTAKQTAKVECSADKGEALIDSYRVDENYGKRVLKLSESQLKAVAGLVMGEMGGEGYIGCCLSAQAIKDRMIDMNCFDVYAFKKKAGYTAAIKSNPNEDSIKAVNYVFNEGGYAVKHRILYMYGSGICYSAWHETQKFIVEYNKERYFDKW